MAQKIHEEVLTALQNKTFSEANAEERKMIIEQTRLALKRLVDELLAEPNKKSISMRDIRLRLNGFLKYEMDRDAQDSEISYEFSKIHPDGRVEHVDHDVILDKCAEEMAQGANTLENAYEWHDINILELLRLGVFSRDEISNDNVLAIAQHYERIKSIFFHVKAARIRGDYRYEMPVYGLESVDYPHIHFQKNNNDSNIQQSLLTSELINKYCESQINDKSWKDHTLALHKGRVENIIDILGDKRINDITRLDIRNIRETLLKLPPSRKKIKALKNKTIDELMKIEHKQTLTVSTVNIIIEAISSMFEWAIREDLLKSNPAKGLTIRDDRSDLNKREAFTKEEIQSIFFNGDYRISSFSNPAYYWVPLIALYTGMRLEEICQLHCEDIYRCDDNIYIFDICTISRDGLNGKILKTKNAVRKIPIHTKLIELGLLEYMEKMKKSKEIRLFPKLNKTEKSPKYGKQVGKNFSALLKRKNIAGKKSFHSLRHTFAQFYKERDLHNATFRQIFGHEQTELASRTYGSNLSIKKCYDEIISILDYSMLHS